MNRGFGKTLAFTNIYQNFIGKEPSFTAKDGSGRLIFVLLHFKRDLFGTYDFPKWTCSILVWNLFGTYRISKWTYSTLVRYLCETCMESKGWKGSENERETALICVLSHFKRALFESYDFQTGSIQALFEPYHISNGFYSSSVRVLFEPYEAF